MEHTTVLIDGMSCGHCVAHVRKALAALPHVQVDTVDIGGATIHYDAGAVSATDIEKAVSSAGYTVRSQRPASAPSA